MSVILNFKTCESSGCDSIQFYETTGEYNEFTNSTGWTEIEITTVEGATLDIVTPGGSTYTINLFATGNFPTINKEIFYSIFPTDIGLTSSDKIPDGVYQFTYNVTYYEKFDLITISQSKNIPMTCQVECCVNSMLKDIDVECDCSEDKIVKYNKAYLMLKGLKRNCGNITEFNKVLSSLQKICKNKNCDNCK